MTDIHPQEDKALIEATATAQATEAVIGPPREDKRGGGSRARQILRSLLISLPLIALVMWTIGPFLVTISVSLKEKTAVFSQPETRAIRQIRPSRGRGTLTNQIRSRALRLKRKAISRIGGK